MNRTKKPIQLYMNDATLQDMTLATWAASVWQREVRGVPLKFHEAALGICMRQHPEWRSYWDNLVTKNNEDTPRLGSILVHIYNDAAVQLQLDTKNPPEIHELYERMRAQGFSEVDALHQLAFVLQDLTWQAKTNGRVFDVAQYVEKAKEYVQAVLAHPKLARTSRTKLRALRVES